MNKYMYKKDLIISSCFFLFFQLVEEYLLYELEFYKNGPRIVFVFGLLPTIYIIILYLYRKYSFWSCWEFPFLGSINLVIPTYWLVIYDLLDGYAPKVLKYYPLVECLGWIYIFILMLAIIRQKHRRIKTGDCVL